MQKTHWLHKKRKAPQFRSCWHWSSRNSQRPCRASLTKREACNIHTPAPKDHGHTPFLTALCSLGESPSFGCCIQYDFLCPTVLLRVRWVYRIYFHYNPADGGCARSGHTSVWLKASAAYFPWCCALFFSLTHALESSAQSCFSPPVATFTRAAAKTASPHCLKLTAPEAVLTDVAWLIKVWFLSPLSFLLVTENTEKISYVLALLCEPSEFRTHVWRFLWSKYGNGRLKSTLFFPLATKE